MMRREEEQSLSDLLKDLLYEVKTLLKQEADLVRAEMSKKASRVSKDLVLVGIGAALAYGGLLVLLAAVVLIVAQVLPVWVSAILVGLLVVGTGYGLIQKGLHDIKKVNPVPQESINALKEEEEWIAQPIR